MCLEVPLSESRDDFYTPEECNMLYDLEQRGYAIFGIWPSDPHVGFYDTTPMGLEALKCYQALQNAKT